MEGSKEQEDSNVEETELGINLGSSFIHRESDMNEAWKSYWKSMVKKIMMTDKNPEQREQQSNISFDIVSIKAARYLSEWGTRVWRS